MPNYPGADGAQLPYDDNGTQVDRVTPAADPVIVLSGGAARHPEYLGDLSYLGTGVRTVVPHLRGVGRSPASSTNGSASWWRQADDIEALRLHLGLDRVTLVAHSAGTRIALAYAAAHPNRVARLVLLTPPAHYLVDVASDVPTLVQRRAGEPAFEAAMVLLAQDPDLSSDDALTRWQQATAPAGYAAWGPVEQAHSRVGAWSATAIAAFFAGNAPTDLAERAAAVDAPVLVVAGTEDALTGLAPVVAVAGLFPRGQVALIEGSGHYPWVEQPEKLWAAVTAFLDGSGTDDLGAPGRG